MVRVRVRGRLAYACPGKGLLADYLLLTTDCGGVPRAALG